VVSSFEAPVLEHLAALAPAWSRWLNADDLAPDTIRRALDLGCRGVSVEWRALDARSVEGAGAAGLEVAAWTVRRRPTARRLERLGVVALCLEGPALDG
jgi:glycerophosphoryl diester phosphodiesterase